MFLLGGEGVEVDLWLAYGAELSLSAGIIMRKGQESGRGGRGGGRTHVET
jgi:hypothetical protein